MNERPKIKTYALKVRRDLMNKKICLHEAERILTEKRIEHLNNSLVKLFDDIRRFKSTRNERMFFAEHRRLQLVHEIEKWIEDSDVFNAMKASVV